MSEILDVESFFVLQAGDTLGALTILRKHAAIDVLVTNPTMPGADGITLISHAREFRRGLPAILLTGYAGQVTSMSAIAGGNVQVMAKPVESEHPIEQLSLLVKSANP